MLSTNFEDYEKGEVQRASMGALLGTGIFMSDGMPLRLIEEKVLTKYVIKGRDGSQRGGLNFKRLA